MATVTGIIDGIGSFGAAFGQILVRKLNSFLQIGASEQYFGWDSVFIMMSFMVFLSALPLINKFKTEMREVL